MLSDREDAYRGSRSQGREYWTTGVLWGFSRVCGLPATLFIAYRYKAWAHQFSPLERIDLWHGRSRVGRPFRRKQATDVQSQLPYRSAAFTAACRSVSLQRRVRLPGALERDAADVQLSPGTPPLLPVTAVKQRKVLSPGSP